MGVSMSHPRDYRLSLLYRLDLLHLELELAREHDYAFMQERIKYEIERAEGELVEIRESTPTNAESEG
jgi:hypothetical protein